MGIYCSAGAILPGREGEGGRRFGTKHVPYSVGLGQAVELLTSDSKWRDNADLMERIRS